MALGEVEFTGLTLQEYERKQRIRATWLSQNWSPGRCGNRQSDVGGDEGQGNWDGYDKKNCGICDYGVKGRGVNVIMV